MTGSPPGLMIEAVGLRKRYGDHLAVDGVDLVVPEGRILAVLGPNGAGKSTTVRMLTTMTAPDGGSARVAGLDVVADAREVRRRIGVTGQDASVDEVLTGRQNLVLVGELSGLRRRDAKATAVQLLDRFDLTDAADRDVKGYSGGMRRRLDLAASLVTRPPVLFLDEPTTGLDPTSRQRMWTIIRDLVSDGTTLLLTTQYLDEADELADAITVIDHGRVIANGSADELKAALGADQMVLTLSVAHTEAVATLRPLVDGDVLVSSDGRELRAPVRARSGLATSVVLAFQAAGITIDDVTVHRPTLDEVFFALTGETSNADPDSDDPSLDLTLAGVAS